MIVVNSLLLFSLEFALLIYLKGQLKGKLNLSILDDAVADMLYMLRDIRLEQLMLYATLYFSFLLLCRAFPVLFFILFVFQVVSLCMSCFMIVVLRGLR